MFDITVVIPVYNREKELVRAIESVLRQKCDYSVEIIVVDDCSNNSSVIANIVNSFKDKGHLRLIRHEINKHGGAARNTGIFSANSDFIALLDSDDEWKEDKLSTCIEVLKSDNSIDAVYSQLALKGKKEGIYPSRGLYADENFMDYLLVSNGTIQTSTLVLRKHVFDIIKFDETLKRFQDYDLVYKMQMKGVSLKYIDRVLVSMYDDDQQNRISNSFNPEPAEYWFNKVKEDLTTPAQANFTVKRIVHYYSQSGKKNKALKYLLDSNNFRYVNFKTLLKELLLILLPLFLLNSIRKYRIR